MNNHHIASLSIVIPAYNEEHRIARTLDDVAKFIREYTMENSSEIFIVDDGSTDATREIALQFQVSNPTIAIHVERNDRNRGKGFSIHHGIDLASKDFVLFMDADNSTPISEIEKLFVYTGEYDVVIGSRHLRDSTIYIPQPLFRTFLGRVANYAIRLFLIRGIKDTQCGFKLFKTKIAKKIFEKSIIERWFFDVEILVIAHIQGYKIKEVAVTWFNSSDSHLKPFLTAFSLMRELIAIKRNIWRGKYLS